MLHEAVVQLDQLLLRRRVKMHDDAYHGPGHSGSRARLVRFESWSRLGFGRGAK